MKKKIKLVSENEKSTFFYILKGIYYLLLSCVWLYFFDFIFTFYAGFVVKG